MNVVVDTSVWSEVLRRTTRKDERHQRDIGELINEGRIVMLGPVRQELLSGVRTGAQFKKLRDALRPFLDYEFDTADFEDAAECFNRCRRKGVQGSNTDFLICAVALRNGFEIFSTDNDFENFRKALRVKLYKTRFPLM